MNQKQKYSHVRRLFPSLLLCYVITPETTTFSDHYCLHVCVCAHWIISGVIKPVYVTKQRMKNRSSGLCGFYFDRKPTGSAAAGVCRLFWTRGRGASAHSHLRLPSLHITSAGERSRRLEPRPAAGVSDPPCPSSLRVKVRKLCCLSFARKMRCVGDVEARRWCAAALCLCEGM